MRILFLTSNEEDYLSDGLLHGLRSLLGSRVVDFPKQEPMYRSYPIDRATQLYGRGFTLYRTLEDIPVDRFHVFRDLRAGRFDLVVVSDVWRQFGQLAEIRPFLGRVRVAAVDGSDSAAPFPYAGHVWREPASWLLGRLPASVSHFKREITPETWHYRTHKILPRWLCRHLPPPRAYRPISFSFPAEKIVSRTPRKTKQFPRHIVDRELAELMGGSPSYPFSNEADYYRDLQESRFGITMKRGGWDCLRHYEIAANGSVPCFRDLDDKPVNCAPQGLHRGNCVVYRSGPDLLQQLQDMPEQTYARLLEGAAHWIRMNTTLARATQFLVELGFDPPAGLGTTDTPCRT